MKILTALILYTFFFVQVAWGWGNVYWQPAAAGGDDYSDITLWLSWENCGGSPCSGANYTLGSDDYSADDSETTYNSAVEINNAGAKVGSYGMDSPTGGDTHTLTVSSSTSGVIAGWFHKYTSWGNNAQFFVMSDGGSEYLMLETYSDDTLRITWDDGTQKQWSDTTPAILVTDSAWFYFQITYNATTDLMKLEIADSDDVAMTEVINTTGTAFDPITFTTFSIGTVGSGYDIYNDNLAISNDVTRDFFPLRNETTSPR